MPCLPARNQKEYIITRTRPELGEFLSNPQEIILKNHSSVEYLLGPLRKADACGLFMENICIIYFISELSMVIQTN